MVESINIVLFWTIFFLTLLAMVTYLLVICTVKELVSPTAVFLNFFRIWRISIPFFKKVLVLIPKIFFAWATFLAVVYLLLFLVIKLHFIYFDTWEILLPEFAGGATFNSYATYNMLTFNNFLKHISFLKVYFFFFYDSLLILLDSLWATAKSLSPYITKALILNTLCLPILLAKFIICDAYSTLSETFLVVTDILYISSKLFSILISYLYEDAENWITLAIFDFMLVMSCFLWFCHYIYLLHDHNYYKDKSITIIIFAVLRNIFFFLVLITLSFAGKNVCVHMDKFLLITYGYQWKITSASICVGISQFLHVQYSHILNYVIFFYSLDDASFSEYITELNLSDIHKYLLVGSSLIIILISWVTHLYSTFLGLRFFESLDMQCTETKKLIKLEQQNSNKTNASFYVLVIGFTLIFTLNAFGPEFFTKLILNSFLLTLFGIIVDFICTFIMLFLIYGLFIGAWVPNLFYHLYIFICLSIIIHFILTIYIKYNIVTRWQVSQNFGVRDNSISEYDPLTIVDLLLLFFYTIWAFFKYFEYGQDETFYEFITTKID